MTARLRSFGASARQAGARGSMAAGVIAAVLLAGIYGARIATLDFGRTQSSFWSDEATYYLMGHSLAADGDLAYRSEDLRRAFREFPSGPSGIFLKKGRDVTGISLSHAPPFIAIEGRDDPDQSRLFFGKSFIYPAFASPFVWIFGTNGFLIFNLVLLALAFLAAYLFLAARSGTVVSLLLAGGFIMASPVPVYVVWMMPELFNFTLGLVACFLWVYKYVAPPGSVGWLGRPATDVVAAALIGVATFSKLTNGVLLLPMLAWFIWQRQWKRAIVVAHVAGLVAIALFAVNVAITGEWNYQGGARGTFYNKYPFQEPGIGFEAGAARGRDKSLLEVLFDPEVFWTNLAANIRYFVVGRYTGLLAYFFPALFAMGAFLFARRQRLPWQWLMLAAVLAHIAVQLLLWPYTYSGSGGSLGNRYFIGVYGACVFLLPPIQNLAMALVPWVVGGLFVGTMVWNPIYVSAKPFDPPKSGLFRWLPVELTLQNDLPFMNERHRNPTWYGKAVGELGFQIHYLDDNSYLREADEQTFWIRGAARTEFLIKTDRPCRELELTLDAPGLPVATTVTVTIAGRRQTVEIKPGETERLRLALPPGFPYKMDREIPARIWVASISSSHGFTPPAAAGDTRYLGVRVRPIVYQ